MARQERTMLGHVGRDIFFHTIGYVLPADVEHMTYYVEGEEGGGLKVIPGSPEQLQEKGPIEDHNEAHRTKSRKEIKKTNELLHFLLQRDH